MCRPIFVGRVLCITFRAGPAVERLTCIRENMGHKFGGIGILFRLVAFVYFMILFIILIRINSQTFDKLFESGVTIKYASVNKTQSERAVRNVTKYEHIYINKTVVIFRDRYKRMGQFGPGENGTKVEIPEGLFSKELLNKTKARDWFHGYNTFLSDVVSIHRTVPDMRPQVCKDKVYPEHLPPVSVVLIFRDEWPSIVLRTAYSVLENSPPELVNEIILVDDGSIDGELKLKIAVHVSTVDKFKLVTNVKPLGLMMARQKGIEAATAEYFVVMDGHMEVGAGWLEPLINRLLEEPNALLCSHVGAIMGENFMYKVDEPTNMNFDTQFPFFDPLTLDQQWVFYRESYRAKRNHSVEPLEYGTIQGMMAVMRKEFFMRLGGFDPGMKVWGSEQMELSFKVWMCGGRVEMIPCSKVAHMYRGTPWGRVNVTYDFGSANKRRTIDVWMDQPYRSFVEDYISNRKYEYGDLSDRLRIRRENNCKPYQFFVDKIHELSDVFFPTFAKKQRTVYNRYKNKCLDVTHKPNTTDKFELILYSCHGNSNQNLMLTENDQIRSSPWLILTTLDVRNTTVLHILKSVVNYYERRSYWNYRQDGTIYNRASGLCLTAITSDDVGLRHCSAEPVQIWEWNRVFKKS